MSKISGKVIFISVTITYPSFCGPGPRYRRSILFLWQFCNLMSAANADIIYPKHRPNNKSQQGFVRCRKTIHGCSVGRPFPTNRPTGGLPVLWRSRWDAVYVGSQLPASLGCTKSTPGDARGGDTSSRNDSSLETNRSATRNARAHR